MEKHKILVVDDVKINRKILAKILYKKYEMVEAEHGQEALEVLKANQDIFLILLDIYMPVMNGYQFMEKLKEDIFLMKIPIIVISSENTSQNRKEAFRLGAKDFIVKPYNENDIEFCVQKIRDSMST